MNIFLCTILNPLWHSPRLLLLSIFKLLPDEALFCISYKYDFPISFSKLSVLVFYCLSLILLLNLATLVHTFLVSNTFRCNSRLKVGKKISKSWTTPQTLDWNILRCAKSNCACFSKMIWIIIMKFKMIIKN